MLCAKRETSNVKRQPHKTDVPRCVWAGIGAGPSHLSSIVCRPSSITSPTTPRPNPAEVIELSAKSGEGLAQWLDWVLGREAGLEHQLLINCTGGDLKVTE